MKKGIALPSPPALPARDEHVADLIDCEGHSAEPMKVGGRRYMVEAVSASRVQLVGGGSPGRSEASGGHEDQGRDAAGQGGGSPSRSRAKREHDREQATSMRPVGRFAFSRSERTPPMVTPIQPPIASRSPS